MEKLPIRLEDLVPKEASFELSTHPGRTFTLGRWSLRVRAWAVAKYGHGGLKEIFEKQKIEEIADISFFLLKNPEQFADKDAFMEEICTIQDQINLVMALLATIGIGEPEVKKLTEKMKAESAAVTDPKPQAPKKKIGAKSSTP